MNHADRRKEEARELITQLITFRKDMNGPDRSFYSRMLESFSSRDGCTIRYHEPPISQNQLFWLRNLRDQYVLGTEN